MSENLPKANANPSRISDCHIFMAYDIHNVYYRKTSNISRTLVGSKIVDNSDAVGASPVGAAPTTSSFST